jgi:MFS family permease
VTATLSPPLAAGILTRRLRPLQIGTALQGFMLWLPVEKLFQTQIGFDAASIALMAAAYSAVIPLLEVPTGIMADRWSRSAILILASVAAAASALVGGLSHNVATYIAAALILGVCIAMNSGTVDSVVYDTIMEETGSSDLYETWIGRVRIVESASLAGSAIAGGLIAGWTTPRITYLLSIPFGLAAALAFSRFREPQLHRATEPVALRQHVATTVKAMTQLPQVRMMLLITALTALLSQAIFEFGPLWLVALNAPAAAYGPYWAVLVGTLGLGGYLAGKLNFGRPRTLVVLAVGLTAGPLLLATSHTLLVVAVAQTGLGLLLAIIGIHVGRLLHDAVPSTIRAGVSSGAGTFSWVLFLPFSLVFGALARTHSVYLAGWTLAGVAAALTPLIIVVALRDRSLAADPQVPPEHDIGAGSPEGARLATSVPPPPDLACRELVTILSDYLDGVLPADWRSRVEDHLNGCDGCTVYLAQIRATAELLTQLHGEPLAPSGAI